jgi:hypothetical protein
MSDTPQETTKSADFVHLLLTPPHTTTTPDTLGVLRIPVHCIALAKLSLAEFDHKQYTATLILNPQVDLPDDHPSVVRGQEYLAKEFSDG